MSVSAPPPTVTADEWQVLWERHRAAELQAARAAQHEKAAEHRRRREELARFIAPADLWERNWSEKA